MRWRITRSPAWGEAIPSAHLAEDRVRVTYNVGKWKGRVDKMPVVKLYANLRKLTGTKELSVAPPSGMLRSASRGSTVGAVLNELIRQNPALEGAILQESILRPHVVVTLNGHNVVDLDTVVNEQDVIAVFPPIAGG